MTGGDLLFLGLMAAGLWWLARDANRERKWVEYAERGMRDFEHLLARERDGWGP